MKFLLLDLEDSLMCDNFLSFYRYLKLLLRKEGVILKTTAEFEIVRTIKETACYVSNTPRGDEPLETEKISYALPDGSSVEVSACIYMSLCIFTDWY